MLATQYSIPLPADYDMSVIRHRVAQRGHLLDGLSGLGLKAYLVEDVANGGRRNQYAPFYLWTESAAASRFFWGGGGFSGVVRDFGRPPLSVWLGAAFLLGPDRDVTPSTAVLSRWMFAPASDPIDEAGRLRAAAEEQAAAPNVHSTAAFIDPVRWEAGLFTLRTRASEDAPAGATVYDVLHLSTPEIQMLDDVADGA